MSWTTVDKRGKAKKVQQRKIELPPNDELTELDTRIYHLLYASTKGMTPEHILKGLCAIEEDNVQMDDIWTSLDRNLIHYTRSWTGDDGNPKYALKTV